MKKITPKELYNKINQTNPQLYILDVRSEEKYQNEHIEHKNVESINIPKTEIFEMEHNKLKELPALPKNIEVVVVCTTGNSATKCTKILAEKGYDVTLLEGGITSWKENINS